MDISPDGYKGEKGPTFRRKECYIRGKDRVEGRDGGLRALDSETWGGRVAKARGEPAQGRFSLPTEVSQAAEDLQVPGLGAVHRGGNMSGAAEGLAGPLQTLGGSGPELTVVSDPLDEPPSAAPPEQFGAALFLALPSLPRDIPAEATETGGIEK